MDPSARDLVALSPVDRITDLHRLPAAQQEPETTEGAALSDPPRALDVLHRLRMLGMQLSVDHHGTGQASLPHLGRPPVTGLEIDRSLVPTPERDAEDRTIVRSTIELAAGLGPRVVAEGVEPRQTWQQLSAMGCDEAQGHWLGRPGPADGAPARSAETQRRTAGGAGAESVSSTTGRAPWSTHGSTISSPPDRSSPSLGRPRSHAPPATRRPSRISTTTAMCGSPSSTRHGGLLRANGRRPDRGVLLGRLRGPR